MTNGEKIKEIFPDSHINEMSHTVWVGYEAMSFRRDWWSAEYKEPTTKNEAKYCDRNICLKNEYNNVGCENCEVTKSQESTQSPIIDWNNCHTSKQLDSISITKDDLAHHKQNIKAYAHDFGVSEEQAQKELNVTTKDNLGVDCISRQEVLRLLANSVGKTNTYIQTEVLRMSSVTSQEPRWIPVSEYLPVTNDEVLVTYIVNGNTKKRYVETANCFDGEWSSVNDEYRTPNTKIEIIAWCEMPKPYRELEE